MVTKSYVIPVGDLSLDERRSMRQNGDDWLLEAAARLAIRDRESDLVIRDVLPGTDLGLATTEDWLVAGAGVAGTDLQYFVPTLAIDRCIAMIGLSYESPPYGISRFRATLGAASAQTRGMYQIEALFDRLETAGYFSEIIGFIRQEVVRGMVLPRLAFAANSQRLKIISRLIEPIGGIVSAPSV